LIQTNIANLAGVPSIVYGILGLALFVRAFGIRGLAMGPVLLAGVLTLSLLILPIVVIATQEALRAVPHSLRQAALALGATRWQMVRDHVLPTALPGILTGTILGLSRAIGETAPVLMVGAAGAIRVIPKGPLDRYSALPVEIYNYAKEPDRRFQVVAAGGILILVAILLVMNGAAIMIRNRFRRYH
jgi:phosphate transport system permease protein